jgi:hypothetical protein
MSPIREFEQADEFMRVRGKDLAGQERSGLWAPRRGFALMTETRRCNWDALPKDEIARPVATMEHFQQSARRLRPSVDGSFLGRYEDWTRKLGEVGV